MTHSATMQLDELPTELLLIIFALACTGPDASSTARALALTSHRIRAVSAPFLYQKLVLAGLPALSAGLSHLLTLPARNRHVQHLFLSDKPAPCAPEDEAEAAALAHDIESVYAVARTEQAHDADADEAALFPALADALLRLLAPDLRTLTVVVFNPLQSELFARLLAVPFPRLTSLALRLSEQRLLLPSFSRPPSPSGGSQSPPPSPASTTASFFLLALVLVRAADCGGSFGGVCRWTWEGFRMEHDVPVLELCQGRTSFYTLFRARVEYSQFPQI
ncbi:hypothetical protein EVG20_g10349 [Dentipellis fragilis]|uniref:F-box domain-containing protein n=1 Tax=Dentipellis fragilis TaxID=205917 RepID=A0A4Y9XU45_9AGAM|nr:hypothetical protein EVG20_g10349 [Dentipellis fragilis]